MMNNKNKQGLPSGKQEGAVVITIVLVLLTVLTIVGLTSAKKATVETKMTTNTIDRQKAYLAAEEAVKYAWDQVNSGFDVKKYVSNCDEDGVYDLRSSNTVTNCTKMDEDDQTTLSQNTKNASGWRSVKGPGDWDWTDTTKRQEADLDLATSNPMKITANPQYRTGIHDAVIRKGTEGFQCIPLSVLGAGKGVTANAQVLIEINAIPKGGCFQTKSGF